MKKEERGFLSSLFFFLFYFFSYFTQYFFPLRI